MEKKNIKKNELEKVNGGNCLIDASASVITCPYCNRKVTSQEAICYLGKMYHKECYEKMPKESL